MQEPGFIPGQGTRSHMLQLRLKCSQIKIGGKKEGASVMYLGHLGRLPGGRSRLEKPSLLHHALPASVAKNPPTSTGEAGHAGAIPGSGE